MLKTKVSRKKMEEQLLRQAPRKRICAIALCHEIATIQMGDLNLCEEHKDCIPMLPFNFFEDGYIYMMEK